MCTVSFIPVNDAYILTSNRDEKKLRGPAVPPAVYTNYGARLLYPKDADAGGTWISVNQNGNAGVLLNGAFSKHIAAPTYRKSRGLVLLELLSAKSPVLGFKGIDLHNIEPFTMVLLEDNQLYECRWDGNKKYRRLLAIDHAYIWSSCTLYSEVVVQKRERWFTRWRSENPQSSPEEISRFHHFAGDGDEQNDLLMNREGNMRTVSITSLEMSNSKASMVYYDKLNNKSHQKQIQLTSSFIPA